MDYLNVKAMNDALARFPTVMAELETMLAELATAQAMPDGPARELQYAVAQFTRTKARLEACRDDMTDAYLSAPPLSWPGCRVPSPQGPAARSPSTLCVEGERDAKAA